MALLPASAGFLDCQRIFFNIPVWWFVFFENIRQHFPALTSQNRRCPRTGRQSRSVELIAGHTIEAGNNHILRYTDLVSFQYLAGRHCHSIICTDNRLRQISALNPVLHGPFRRTVPVFSIGNLCCLRINSTIPQRFTENLFTEHGVALSHTS